MKRFDPFILGIIFFMILVLFGGIIFAFKESGKSIRTYSADDRDRPIVELSVISQDLGQMKVSDIKSADFIIKNSGTKPLIINNISTSCDCTFTQIEIDGKTSPRFSMHKNPNWIGEIRSGKEAKLTTIYEPSIMPVKGAVIRNVFFTTNDPQNQNISLTVTATVE